MLARPFDREVINVRERPLASDLDSSASKHAATLLALLENMNACGQSGIAVGDMTGARAPFVAVGSARFYGDALMLQPTTGMVLNIMPGLGFANVGTTATSVGGLIGVDEPSPFRPLVLEAVASVTVPAADASLARVDLLEVRLDSGQLVDTYQRMDLDVSGRFVPTAIPTTLSYAADGGVTVNGSGAVNYKSGTPSTSPTAPLPSPGCIGIGRVNVAARQTSIDFSSVIDDRALLVPGNMLALNFQGALCSNNGEGAGPSSAVATMAGIRVGGFRVGTGGDGDTVFVIAAGGRALDLGAPSTFTTPGGGGATCVPIGMTTPTGSVGSEIVVPFSVPVDGVTIATTITPTMQSYLADSSRSLYPTKFAVGQSVIVCRFKLGLVAQNTSNTVLVSTGGGSQAVGLSAFVPMA